MTSRKTLLLNHLREVGTIKAEDLMSVAQLCGYRNPYGVKTVLGMIQSNDETVEVITVLDSCQRRVFMKAVYTPSEGPRLQDMPYHSQKSPMDDPSYITNFVHMWSNLTLEQRAVCLSLQDKIK